VMARRGLPKAGLDDFPTPPWATRALFAHVLATANFAEQSCLEPACGDGHMARVLAEVFGEVRATDIAAGQDFLKDDCAQVDWVITNPPFRLAEQFILRALPLARQGVAIFCRTVFLESAGRYRRLFEPHPPAIVAPFVERVALVQGRLDPKATTATSYAWFVWAPKFTSARLRWIPPCRSTLERDEDYLCSEPSAVF
jgi:hypothetical protein